MIKTKNRFFNQAVNRFNSALKSGFLTWESKGIVSFLEPASRGHRMKCSFLHVCICLIAQPGMLPLGYDVSNESSTIYFVYNYFCHRFLSTALIHRCTPIFNITTNCISKQPSFCHTSVCGPCEHFFFDILG